jgi:hypothetical protein
VSNSTPSAVWVHGLRFLTAVQFACGGFDLADRPRSIDDVRTFVSSLNGLDSVPPFLYDLLDAVQDMEDAGWELDARYSDVRIRKSILFFSFECAFSAVPSISPIRPVSHLFLTYWARQTSQYQSGINILTFNLVASFARLAVLVRVLHLPSSIQSSHSDLTTLPRFPFHLHPTSASSLVASPPAL